MMLSVPKSVWRCPLIKWCILLDIFVYFVRSVNHLNVPISVKPVPPQDGHGGDQVRI